MIFNFVNSRMSNAGTALVTGVQALPLAAILALGLIAPATAQEAATAAPVSEYPAISVTTVAPVLLRHRVIVSGLVQPVEEVQVQPLIDGQAVESLLVDVGDWVEAGQALALLSGSTFDLQMSELRAQGASVEAAIAQAQASLIEAQTAATEAERVETRNIALREQGTISAAAAEQSEAAADAARARVRVAEQGIVSAEAQRELIAAQMASLELRRDRTEVRTPVTGLVVARNARVGAIASGMGEPMFTLVRDGALEMRAEVSEADLLRLSVGQTAIMASVGGTAPITGTVRMIAPTIDTATRLGDARISIETPDAVRQGMFLTAEILVTEAEQLAVPVTAVGASAQGTTVMRVTDGVVQRVPVVTGIREGGMIGIVSGIEPGDQIVTRAAAFVRDGDRINPVPDASVALSEEG
jgi:HlyD family secretion protein